MESQARKTTKKKTSKKKTSKTTRKPRISSRGSIPVVTDDEIKRLVQTGKGRKKIYLKPHWKKIKVSPKKAKEWLANNFNRNRPITWARVQFFKREALAGRFKTTGQGVTFSWHGDLMDGQHRLHGIVESGVTVEMWVMFGEDPANFYLYDDHRPRSVGDVLTTIGIKDGKNIAAIYKKVLDLIKMSPDGYSAMGHRKWTEYSKAGAIVWARAEENQEVLGEITDYLRAKKDLAELRTPPSILGALYFIFSQYSIKDTREFFGSLRDGANLPSTSPILWARKTLMTLRDDFKKKYWQSPPQFVYPAVIIRAWNDWMANRRVRDKYPIQKRGEKFPVIEEGTRRRSRS